jgi:O-antigen ligase
MAPPRQSGRHKKIVYNGWTGVLFWFTAAAICLVSSQLFHDRRIAAQFRLLFVVFGSALCVLDLLEQASHTNKYFGIVQSRYATVNGTFAYWNNFAQFVELVLPITLWLGVARGRPSGPFLILSGLQIGAVIASGSRAGSALVIVEFVAVMVIAYFRNRNRALLYAVGSALLLILMFSYAAGVAVLRDKLQQRDQVAVRRDVNLSSLAMIRERPLSGWGLGTYVPVYRAFARQDDGTYVNQAHNDWLEWTAEGGVLFSALMAVVFVWSIKPAIRSVWGIGVIALCLHAAVDYPFARFGVCGWYFALLGMLAATYASGQRQHRTTNRSLTGLQ